MSRSRSRRGLHESISGAPAESTLKELVSQFSNPHDFIRELIQNSLDASAIVIDIDMSWADGELTIAVTDDGEGMDREIIEGYLLTLFRSTKEEDLTKIGKFGIGFVSLFAMEPYETTVDTGRDGIWHRVVFDQAREWTLLEMADPFEGTCVTIKMKTSRRKARETCERVRDAAVKWCRFADAEIHTSASGIEGAWEAEPVEATFEVDSPVSVHGSGDGWRAVVGITAEAPFVGFFNQGITLWQGETTLFPGVTVLAEGRHLEHTLTRDNVRRDRHFDKIVEEIRALIEGPLRDAVRAAAREASTDLASTRTLFKSLTPGTTMLDELDPIFPSLRDAAIRLDELRPEQAWLDRLRGLPKDSPEFLWITGPNEELARHAALEMSDTPILRGLASDPHIRWLSNHFGDDRPLTPLNISELWRMTKPAKGPTAELVSSLQSFASDVGQSLLIYPTTFHGGGETFAARLAVREHTPHQPHRHEIAQSTHVAVNVDHPLLQQLLQLPPRHAHPLLLRAILVDLSVRSGAQDWMLPRRTTA